jgi:hypothetical protein
MIKQFAALSKVLKSLPRHLVVKLILAIKTFHLPVQSIVEDNARWLFLGGKQSLRVERDGFAVFDSFIRQAKDSIPRNA